MKLPESQVGEILSSRLSNTGKAIQDIWPFFLPVILLIPGIVGFAYPPAPGAYSDVSVTHFPNALFLLRSLLSWKTIPLWSPSILSGYPFAANPLSGLWYPPGWLALLFPLPLGFNLVIALHLIWAGWGMYRLLRAEGVSRLAGMLGGLALCCLPKLYAHYGAGHLTLIYAFCWTPWLLLSTRHWLAPGKNPPVPYAGIILSLIFLADVRWIAYAGLLWLAYTFSQPLGKPIIAAVTSRAKYLGLHTCLAILLSGPLLVPFVEFVRLSTRALLTSQESTTFALPPGRLLGLLFPDFGGYFEWVFYPGASILLLALLGLIARRNTLALFWIAAAGLTLALALGPALPLQAVLEAFPGYNLLRVPSRWLFITGIALAAGSGHGLDWLLENTKNLAAICRARLFLFAAGCMGATLAIGAWFMSGDVPPGFIWGAFTLLLGAGWLAFGLRMEKGPAFWVVGVFLFSLLDLLLVNRSLFVMRPATEVLEEGEQVVKAVSSKTGNYRIYSPSYSLPQQTAGYYGLELANGVDPLQLLAYEQFMQQASGVQIKGYSVTLPALQGGDVLANRAAQPDANLLGLLNVAYVVSEYDLVVDDLVFIEKLGDTRIYANRLVRPRAWLQADNGAINQAGELVDLVSWTPNRIELSTQGAGMLVLSEIAYPGWQVWVDHQRAELTIVDGIFRAVRLGQGNHQVVFLFRPLSVYLGLGLCALGVCALIGFLYVQRK